MGPRRSASATASARVSNELHTTRGAPLNVGPRSSTVHQLVLRSPIEVEPRQSTPDLVIAIGAVLPDGFRRFRDGTDTGVVREEGRFPKQRRAAAGAEPPLLRICPADRLDLKIAGFLQYLRIREVDDQPNALPVLFAVAAMAYSVDQRTRPRPRSSVFRNNRRLCRITTSSPSLGGFSYQKRASSPFETARVCGSAWGSSP